MDIKRLVILNSSVGLLNQLVNIFFQFLVRSVFLQYLGIELLGLNSTYASVISIFELAELGVQTAVLYNLYAPIHNNDIKKINMLINAFGHIYRFIGIVFIIASFITLPFLKYVISGIEIDQTVCLFFLLQSAGFILPYFFAYKRVLLRADQKSYVVSNIDLFVNIFMNILRIFEIIKWGNYYIYLCVTIIQVITANLFINIVCKKKYPYLALGKIDISILKEILSNVKDIFVARIAGYIYASTDNIIISMMLNTVTVGFFSNYQMIMKGIKNIVESVLASLAPLIGQILAGNISNEVKLRQFKVYMHIRYIIALVVVVPCYVLIDDCITLWIGNTYIMSRGVAILLCVDLYIHLIHSECCDYINGMGLFKLEKSIEIIGALINIVSSILLCRSYGVIGILTGTVFSQVWFWIGRSYVVYKYCFSAPKNQYISYWIDNFKFITIILICVIVCKVQYLNIMMDILLIRFIIGGIACVVVALIMYAIFYARCEEFKVLLKFLQK